MHTISHIHPLPPQNNIKTDSINGYKKSKNFQYHTKYQRVYESEYSESTTFHSVAQYIHISIVVIDQIIRL